MTKISLALIVSVVAFFSSSCVGYQTISFEDNTGVIEIFDSLSDSQDLLFIKANDWMVSTFNDATSVIEYSDKEAGVIIGKYKLHGEINHGLYGATTDTRVYAKIEIEVKENKARVIIKPIGSWQYDSSGITIYNYSKEDAIADMQKLADSLEVRLNKVEDDF